MTWSGSPRIRMLRLGPGTDPVECPDGLTSAWQAALRRDILGLPKRMGRHPVLDEAQDVACGDCWQAGVAEGPYAALTDDRAMLALTMDLPRRSARRGCRGGVGGDTKPGSTRVDSV